MQLNAEDGGNRQFILVQLPEMCDEKSESAKAGYPNICEIGKERIRRAGKKLLEEGVTKVSRTDNPVRLYQHCHNWMSVSEYLRWIAPQEGDVIGELVNRMNTMIHWVKPERSDLDMVFEIILKLGVPLDFPVSPVSLNSKTTYSVGAGGLLLICLAEDIKLEEVKQMAEYASAKAIIFRESFADDTAMANAYYILWDKGMELKLV